MAFYRKGLLYLPDKSGTCLSFQSIPNSLSSNYVSILIIVQNHSFHLLNMMSQDLEWTYMGWTYMTSSIFTSRSLLQRSLNCISYLRIPVIFSVFVSFIAFIITCSHLTIVRILVSFLYQISIHLSINQSTLYFNFLF